MPYRLVLTKNGPSEEVTAVPEGWVIGTYLYWPRSLKKSEIESLRSNENSTPDKSWKKIKCRLKLSDICTFKEALHLEELYSKFQDTEDEEMYLHEHQNKKKQVVNILSDQLLDVNTEFDMDVNDEDVNVNPEQNNEEVLSTNIGDTIQVTLKDVEGTSSDDIITLKASELLKIVQENNSLQTENMKELLRSVEFQNETKKNFAIIQTQLDKVIDLLQNKNRMSHDNITTSEGGIDKIINMGNIKFPIETKEQLDELEYKLLEQNVMTYLVRKFSAICGTSGIARFSKVGLPLMQRFIKDDLLNQFTWKGIKGSTKIGFVQYVKIRELFYKVAHLADKSCSFNDSDYFIQNSAIKHSGQRLKRQILSSGSKMNVKRMKKDINVSKEYGSKNNIADAKITDNLLFEEKIKEISVSDNEINDENKDSSNTEKLKGSNIIKEADYLNQPSSSKITILSDVKINDKVVDIENVTKMANISSLNVNAIFDELIKF